MEENNSSNKKKFHTYNIFRNFNSENEANKYILTNKIHDNYWTKFATKKNNNDTKCYYYCKRQKQCPKRLCLSTLKDNKQVVLLISDDEHQHKQPKGLSIEIKNEISKIIDDYNLVSPKTILANLLSSGLISDRELGSKKFYKQMVNFKVNYKKNI